MTLNRLLFALAGLSMLAAAPAAAAEEAEGPIEPGPWAFISTVGLNLSQSSYSSNWSGGDNGSFVWVLNGEANATRQFSKTFNLSNQLKVAYGATSQQETDPNEPDARRWRSPEKSTDLFLFESVGRFTLGKFADPFVSFRLDSQFSDQSDPRGTLSFNPVKLTETAGIARVLEKTEDSEVITRLGFGFRQNFAKAFIDEAGDVTKSFSTNDGGLDWTTDAKYPLFEKRILYTGKLTVFLPVFYSQSSNLEEFDVIAMAVDPTREATADFWRSPDISFQNSFTAQITKIISVNLFVHFVYDKFDAATNVDTALDPALLIREVDGSIRKAGQFKQTLSLGLTYQLF